jgi:hypothetical protein
MLDPKKVGTMIRARRMASRMVKFPGRLSCLPPRSIHEALAGSL